MTHYRSLVGAMALATAMLASAEYYEVTGDNINLRRTANGEAFGKVAKGTFFWSASGPENGWIYMATPLQGGFISDKYIRKVDTTGFSRNMLGEYMGQSTDPAWSYSLGELTENDGWLVLRFTDYSEPMESGMRMSQGYTWVGVPTPEGITFKYNVNYIDPSVSVTDQVAGLPETNMEYVVEKSSDGSMTLRGFNREFTLQESKGVKDPKISERNLADVTGPVKKLTKARSFTPQYMETFNSEEFECRNFVWQISFDPEGFITDYTAIDSDTSIPLRQCQYTRNGNKVKVVGKWFEQPFKADYSIGIDNFSIKYSEGNAVITHDEGTSESVVDNAYYLGWNAMPRDISFLEMGAPFIVESGSEETTSYLIRNGKTAGVTMNLYYGGDGMTFNNLEFRDVQTDSQGNWIRRTAYDKDTPVFLELRNIEYY